MSAHGHGHAGVMEAPQGFLRKYIFSIDHKVIGIQYLLLALFAVLIGMTLSVLMRIRLAWPEEKWPLLQQLFPAGLCRRPDDAGVLPLDDDDARHDHGLLRADHGAAVRLRELLPAHSDRCAGHGVPDR